MKREPILMLEPNQHVSSVCVYPFPENWAVKAFQRFREKLQGMNNARWIKMSSRVWKDYLPPCSLRFYYFYFSKSHKLLLSQESYQLTEQDTSDSFIHSSHQCPFTACPPYIKGCAQWVYGLFNPVVTLPGAAGASEEPPWNSDDIPGCLY